MSRRAVASFDFFISMENICCSKDVMIENFVVNLHDLKRGCLHSCGMAKCDVLRRAATSFKFHNAVKNICCSKDVMIEILVVTLHDLKRGFVHSCGMTSCDVL
jgi:hypothetical protein